MRRWSATGMSGSTSGSWCGFHPVLGFGLPEGCPTQGHPIAHHGSRDVPDLLLAEIVEPDRQFVVDLIVDRAGDQDAAGFRQLLEPRRDVDAVPIDVLTVDHHVAQVDADAKA